LDGKPILENAKLAASFIFFIAEFIGKCVSIFFEKIPKNLSLNEMPSIISDMKRFIK
jgi:hypothetical protein